MSTPLATLLLARIGWSLRGGVGRSRWRSGWLMPISCVVVVKMEISAPSLLPCRRFVSPDRIGCQARPRFLGRALGYRDASRRMFSQHFAPQL